MAPSVPAAAPKRRSSARLRPAVPKTTRRGGWAPRSARTARPSPGSAEQVSQQARTLSGEDLRVEVRRAAVAADLGRAAGTDAPRRRRRRRQTPAAWPIPRVTAALRRRRAAIPCPGAVRDPGRQREAPSEQGRPGDSDYTPRLSADGNDPRVHRDAADRRRGAGGAFGLGAEEYNGDAYWEDMTSARPGPRASSSLTQFGSGER